ncbi:MAG: hypothetical protein ACOYD6_07585 [Limnochordia bacterium]|jgi:hypothetical protein
MKKALVLALVAVFALSAVSFAADVSGSLEAKYEFGIDTKDWTIIDELDSGLPTFSELKLKVADEGWAFDAELRDVLRLRIDAPGADDETAVPAVRLIKAALDDPAVAFTVWNNGKETSDKKDPLEFVKSGKKADSAKYRLEASVFGVNTAFDFDSGNDSLYGFVDTTVDGHKLGLAYLSNLGAPAGEDGSRKRTVVLFGDTSFQGVKVKVGAGMTFGKGVTEDNVMYGADVEVPVPVYEGVSIQGKWRVAQQNAFTSGFTANRRVAEGYVKYGTALMQGKAGVKGTNNAEYNKDDESLEYIAEFTLKEFADGPGFDDVIDDYDLLTGYAVKAELSRTGGKANEDEKNKTNIFLGAGSRFAEGLNAKLAVDYSKGEEKANVLEDARKAELEKVLGDDVTLATNYGSGYTLEAEVTYALGNGITLVPGASFEKYAGGKKADFTDAGKAEWVSASSIGSEVNYALSSNVTLLSELVYEVAKVDGGDTEDDVENKAMKAMFGVKVSF